MLNKPGDAADHRAEAGDLTRAGGSGRGLIPGADLSAARSIRVKPLTPEELRELRRAGRERRSFDDMAGEVLRLQFISAVMPPLGDPEALRGLRRRERALLLELFATGTSGPDELRLAALLSRCAPDHDNTVAMLSAALEFDCMRQGLLAEPGHAG
ncbi:hypothetical protein [Lichenibacterium ramalinae]|uniref:Uncharacterized protein n=1 Tax=Lichenibacterium ramalinae TaxID=2316527 RepID=A0A4Q2RE42_9HYPH|nr:hypothetical protein [Lichenibacterium ramalinae]RYB04318.1 hypothetical protein D3272_12715 [Lichenibacterium ramalinae]